MTISNVSYNLRSGQTPAQHQSRLSALITHVNTVCKTIFNSILILITWPIRYLGSKTWSIPGVILRTPWIVARRVFGYNKGQVTQELFPSHYRFSFEKRLTPDELKEHLAAVSSTAFVHSCKDEFIPKGWKNLSPKGLNLSIPGIDMEEKCIYSHNTQIKISMIEKDQEIIIAFGSLEADGGNGTRAKNPGKGKASNVVQSALGLIPKAFSELDEVVPVLFQQEHFKDKKITFTGNSYGATLAQYVGIKFEQKAVCFNAFALGSGPQYSLGSTRLRCADQHVTHIAVEGDYVTDLKVYKPLDLILSGIGVRTAGNFGRRFTIPSAYCRKVCSKNLFQYLRKAPVAYVMEKLETHGYTLGSCLQHIGYDKRTYPADL